MAEHMSGRRNHGYWLWNVLMAEAWYDQWHTGASDGAR
jgi:asparagine synthase (glutamine-hydrolysing)